MILLRIPCPQLAILAHDKLRTVRDKLGFQYRLDVLLCGSDQEIAVDDYFLKRLRVSGAGRRGSGDSCRGKARGEARRELGRDREGEGRWRWRK